MPETNGERWAVYYAPPADHPLWRLGCRWLGRDPASGDTFDAPSWLAPEAWRSVVATPARYGLHGTLKAPMRLRSGRGSDELRRVSAALAEGSTPFTLPPLAVRRIGDFLALCPTEDCSALDALAAECVRGLDHLREPPSADELARRRPQALSARQRNLLKTWGYPYVLEEFRFHLTLTGPLTHLPPDQADDLQQRLAERFAPALSPPLPVDALTLYHQERGEPFRLIARLPLGAG